MKRRKNLTRAEFKRRARLIYEAWPMSVLHEWDNGICIMSIAANVSEEDPVILARRCGIKVPEAWAIANANDEGEREDLRRALEAL